MDPVTLEKFNKAELFELSRLTITLGSENDDKWIAEVKELPGVLAYGKTKKNAIRKVCRLAKKVLKGMVKEAKDHIYLAEHIREAK